MLLIAPRHSSCSIYGKQCFSKNNNAFDQCCTKANSLSRNSWEWVILCEFWVAFYTLFDERAWVSEYILKSVNQNYNSNSFNFLHDFLKNFLTVKNTITLKTSSHKLAELQSRILRKDAWQTCGIEKYIFSYNSLKLFNKLLCSGRFIN